MRRNLWRWCFVHSFWTKRKNNVRTRFPCQGKWEGFSREGRDSRSSVNKTLLTKVSSGQDKSSDHLKFREIPESNYAAIEFLVREAHSNSLIPIPESFYKANEEYLKGLGFHYLSSSVSTFSLFSSSGPTTSYNRQLKFEVNKQELEKEESINKRKWINEALTQYEKFNKDFKLNVAASFYDGNKECDVNRGNLLLEYKGRPHEVHEVTGKPEEVKNCNQSNKKN
ncbi:hypothetical protein [Mycoplasma suis]|uniref:hypothetical protein n=1 Tax=Mycoplasma suis TaxID=57372 RepID=UPI0011D0E38C|nr:hypothetical protein [Mycoplasma suis]